MSRIQFESLHCDRNEGGAYVHAMVRVLLAEQTVLAEVTVESKDASKLPIAGHELRDWVREKLLHAFGEMAT